MKKEPKSPNGMGINMTRFLPVTSGSIWCSTRQVVKDGIASRQTRLYFSPKPIPIKCSTKPRAVSIALIPLTEISTIIT